jgi:hypothetical protein
MYVKDLIAKLEQLDPMEPVVVAIADWGMSDEEPQDLETADAMIYSAEYLTCACGHWAILCRAMDGKTIQQYAEDKEV